MAGRPTITSPGAGLVGTPGAPSVTPSIVGEVVAVALVVALAATLVPAVRAARTSTVSALASSARRPRRHGTLIRLSGGCRCRCCSECGWWPAGRGAPC